jgi:hypothetical protein
MKRIVSVIVIEQWNWARVNRACTGGRETDLALDLTLAACFVAGGAVSPALDEIAVAGAAGEFEVDSKGVLFCDSEICSRVWIFRGLS